MSNKKTKRPKRQSQAPAGKTPSDSQSGKAPANNDRTRAADQEPVAGPGRAEQKEPAKRLFVFPSVNICPRCRGTYTRVRSTQQNVRYCVCMSAICRHRFTVLGRKIEP